MSATFPRQFVIHGPAPDPENQRPCQVCGEPYGRHDGRLCAVCLHPVQHHDLERLHEEIAGAAHLARARRDAGLPLSDRDRLVMEWDR